MKLFETALAATLSYTLAFTPAFAQDDAEGSTENNATSNTEAAPAEPVAEEKNPEERGKTSVDEPGAPPKGTGKLVGGIVAASVGTGLGLLSLLAGTIDCDDIDKDNANTTDEAKKADREKQVKDCKDQQPTLRAAGGLFLAAGLGVGLPLIYFGVQDRKAYNAWKAQQPGQASLPGQANLVVFTNGRSSLTPGISLSYNF